MQDRTSKTSNNALDPVLDFWESANRLEDYFDGAVREAPSRLAKQLDEVWQKSTEDDSNFADLKQLRDEAIAAANSTLQDARWQYRKGLDGLVEVTRRQLEGTLTTNDNSYQFSIYDAGETLDVGFDVAMRQAVSQLAKQIEDAWQKTLEGQLSFAELLQIRDEAIDKAEYTLLKRRWEYRRELNGLIETTRKQIGGAR